MENLPMISALVGVAGVVFAAILAGVVKGAPAGNAVSYTHLTLPTTSSV